MNSLILKGLSNIKVNFQDYFIDKVKARRVWKLRKKNPKLLRKFVMNEYTSIMNERGVETAYRWSAFLFSGWKEGKLKSFAKKIWRKNLKSRSSRSITPFKEMIDLIRFLNENNWVVYIVTASPQSIIQEVAKEFSVPKENVIGMNLLEDKGIYLPQIIEPYTYGEGKVKALFEKTGHYADISFGDSENDFPLLKSAQRFGVLIDKGNKELADKCKSNNCLIQPFFRK